MRITLRLSELQGLLLVAVIYCAWLLLMLCIGWWDGSLLPVPGAYVLCAAMGLVQGLMER